MKRNTVKFLILLTIALFTLFLFHKFETRWVLFFPICAGLLAGSIDRKFFSNK